MSNLFPTRRDFMDFGGRFFDDFLNQPLSQLASFNTDIQELENEYILEADLPGMTKENIQLNYQNNVLSISAKADMDTEETDQKGNYIRRERSTRSFSRQFVLPDIDEDKVSAKFENGVLKIHLPKKRSDQPNNGNIPIE